MKGLKFLAFGTIASLALVGGVHASITDTNSNGVCTITEEEDIETALTSGGSKPCTVIDINSNMTITQAHDFKTAALRINNATLTIDGGSLTFAGHTSGKTETTNQTVNASISLIGTTSGLDIQSGSVTISNAQGYGIAIKSSIAGGMAATGGSIKVSGDSSLIIDNLGAAAIKSVSDIEVSGNATLQTTNSNSGISTDGTLKICDNGRVIANGNATGIYAIVETQDNASLEVNDNTRIGLSLKGSSKIGGNSVIAARGNGADGDLTIDVEQGGKLPVLTDNANVNVGTIKQYTESDGTTKGKKWKINIDSNAVDLTYDAVDDNAGVKDTDGVIRVKNDDGSYTVNVYGTPDGKVVVNNGDTVVNSTESDVTVNVIGSSQSLVVKTGETAESVSLTLDSTLPAESSTTEAKNPDTSDNIKGVIAMVVACVSGLAVTLKKALVH